MTEPRHGDPFDYSDIPGDSGLSEAYVDATMPPGVKEAIARRKAALAAESAAEAGAEAQRAAEAAPDA